MWAEGEGESLKEAKASALTALSQQVISNVESSFKTEVTVANDNVNRDMKSVKQIKSNLILKGVQYVDESRRNGVIKITAGLDRAAIRSTIDYMQKQIDVDYAILSRDKKEETLVVSDQLTALISVLPGSVLNDFDNVEAWNNKKRKLLLKNIYMGRVLFVSNSSDYSVEVDEKAINSGDFLEEGSYSFSASADGYRTMTGQFTASGGETVKVKLNFIKAVSGKRISVELPGKYDFLEDEIETILSDLGVQLQANAKNKLIVKVKDVEAQVDEFVSHRLKLRIEAYKNNERVKKVTVRKNFFVQQDQKDKVSAELTKLVRKALTGLMSKIDLDEYFD